MALLVGARSPPKAGRGLKQSVVELIEGPFGGILATSNLSPANCE
jgi:hypothetical protein